MSDAHAANALRKLAHSFEQRADSVLLGNEWGLSRRAALLDCANSARVAASNLDHNPLLDSPRTSHSLKIELINGRLVFTPVCHELKGAPCWSECASNKCDKKSWELCEHLSRKYDGQCQAVLHLTHDGIPLVEVCSSHEIFSLYDGMPINIIRINNSATWEPLIMG